MDYPDVYTKLSMDYTSGQILIIWELFLESFISHTCKQL